MEQNQCNNYGENAENACPNCEPKQEVSNSIICTECGASFDAELQVCPNCGCPIQAAAEAELPVVEDFDDCAECCSLGSAIKEFFARIIYVVFVLPFKTWKAGVNRLAAHGEKCNCYDGVKTEWPLITYSRRLFMDFFFDALILISWLSVFAAVWDLLHYGAASICTWVLGIYLCYFMPVLITLVKDIVTLVLRYPIRRFIRIHRLIKMCVDQKFAERNNK